MTSLAIPHRAALRPVHLAAVGLMLWMLFSPVSQLAPDGAAARVPMLLEIALLGALLLRWLLVRLEPAPTHTLIWVAVAVAHGALTGLWAIDERIFLTYGFRTLHGALWTFAVYASIDDRDDLLALLRGLHAMATVAAIVGIAQWLLPGLQVDFMRENTEGARGAALKWDDELGSGAIVRVTGTLAHPLGLALVLSTMLPWTPALWQADPRRHVRAFLLGCTAIQGIGLALTYSRMAVLAVSLATAVFVLRGGARRPLATLAILGCAAIATLPLLPATLVERVFDPTHFRESDSLIARMEMQLYGSDLGMEHGLVGVGYGCYGPAYEATAMGRYVEQARWMRWQEDWSSYDLGDIGAHNTFLEVWVEQGIAGLLLLAGIIGSLLRGLWLHARCTPHGSLDRNLGLSAEAGAIALTASLVVLHVQEAILPWAWLGAACAVVGVQARGGSR